MLFKYIFFLVICVGLFSCAKPYYRIKVKPFKQTDDSRCGPASVKMVLGYYRIEASEDTICVLAKHTYDYGCDDIGMADAIRAFGLKCEIRDSSSYEEIEKYISEGKPVIVDWMAALDGYQAYGHSSVVIDINPTHIFLLDPWSGKVKKLERLEFETVWFDWKKTETISCENIVYKQIIVAYPE